MADILRLLQKMKHTYPVNEEDLELMTDIQVRHFDTFRSVYGEAYIIPKHHYSLHLAPQIRRDGMLFDTFVSL